MQPEDRLSAEDALRHPYFKDLHDEDYEPIFEGNIEDDYEYDNEIDLFKLRKKVLEEINCQTTRKCSGRSY